MIQCFCDIEISYIHTSPGKIENLNKIWKQHPSIINDILKEYSELLVDMIFEEVDSLWYSGNFIKMCYALLTKVVCLLSGFNRDFVFCVCVGGVCVCVFERT